jgi:hypothetical protein
VFPTLEPLGRAFRYIHKFELAGQGPS